MMFLMLSRENEYFHKTSFVCPNKDILGLTLKGKIKYPPIIL